MDDIKSVSNLNSNEQKEFIELAQYYSDSNYKMEDEKTLRIEHLYKKLSNNDVNNSNIKYKIDNLKKMTQALSIYAMRPYDEKKEGYVDEKRGSSGGGNGVENSRERNRNNRDEWEMD